MFCAIRTPPFPLKNTNGKYTLQTDAMCTYHLKRLSGKQDCWSLDRTRAVELQDGRAPVTPRRIFFPSVPSAHQTQMSLSSSLLFHKNLGARKRDPGENWWEAVDCWEIDRTVWKQGKETNTLDTVRDPWINSLGRINECLCSLLCPSSWRSSWISNKWELNGI